ncbi:MAG: ferritin [Planctomycetota bacterium]|jgi:ferritin
MLKNEVHAALNTQVNHEQTAAQEYLAMSAWLDGQNLKGFARYMRTQSDEERMHALKLFDFIHARGSHTVLEQVAQPTITFDSPLAVFKAAQAREQANTASISAAYALAVEHKDYATQTMLQWFIDEQVEEEEWCDEAVALLTAAGDNPAALLMLDERYGKSPSAAPEGE